MADPRVSQLARLLVNYCISVKPGDRVLLMGGESGLPLITETYRHTLRAGGHPLPVWQEEQFTEILLKEGSEAQLTYIAEPTRLAIKSYDCAISVTSASNTRYLSNVDPDRQRVLQASRRDLSEIFSQRGATGDLRWVGTLFPTQAQAQEADMSLSELEDFVYAACHVDKDDPVAEWRKVSAWQQKLVDWLAGKDKLEVRGPNIDLTLSIAGRTFLNSDGRRNMPSGEIFTGPVEDSANGWVRFSFPAIHGGREVDGVELRFENGKVVETSAKKNEAYLQSVLKVDDGARFLGEFAIGTNTGITRFTKSILFDEKIGGTVHMALGSGYPETGSKNKSSLHWDMICDMRDGGRIWVDGELFYDSGRFVVLEN